MIDLTGFPVAILFVFLVCLWWRKKRHPLFPPGYTGIPIFGVAPYITEEPCKVFKKWSLEKFGPIMSARIIYRDVVILNTFEVVHQVCFLRRKCATRKTRIVLISTSVSG